MSMRSFQAKRTYSSINLKKKRKMNLHSMSNNYPMAKMNKASLYYCIKHQENSRIKIKRRVFLYFSLLTDKYEERKEEKKKR